MKAIIISNNPIKYVPDMMFKHAIVNCKVSKSFLRTQLKMKKPYSQAAVRFSP